MCQWPVSALHGDGHAAALHGGCGIIACDRPHNLRVAGKNTAADSRTGVEAWPVLSVGPAAQGRPGEPPHIAWSSGSNRSPGTLAASRRALPFFPEEILQSCVIKHRIGQKPFQAGILVFKTLQPLSIADIHPPTLGLPLVDGRIADPILAAHISNGNTSLLLPQNADDLIFGESIALNLWSFRSGQSLPQTGSAPGGHVNLNHLRQAPPPSKNRPKG